MVLLKNILWFPHKGPKCVIIVLSSSRKVIQHMPSRVSQFQSIKMHRATQDTCSCKTIYLTMNTIFGESKFIIVLCGCSFVYSSWKWKPVATELHTGLKDWQLRYHLFWKYVRGIEGGTWRTKMKMYIHPSISYSSFCSFPDMLKDFSLSCWVIYFWLKEIMRFFNTFYKWHGSFSVVAHENYYCRLIVNFFLADSFIAQQDLLPPSQT